MKFLKLIFIISNLLLSINIVYSMELQRAKPDHNSTIVQCKNDEQMLNILIKYIINSQSIALNAYERITPLLKVNKNWRHTILINQHFAGLTHLIKKKLDYVINLKKTKPFYKSIHEIYLMRTLPDKVVSHEFKALTYVRMSDSIRPPAKIEFGFDPKDFEEGQNG